MREEFLDNTPKSFDTGLTFD